MCFTILNVILGQILNIREEVGHLGSLDDFNISTDSTPIESRNFWDFWAKTLQSLQPRAQK